MSRTRLSAPAMMLAAALLAPLTAAPAVILATGHAVAAEQPPAQQEMTPEMAEMMKLSQPGVHHEHMAKLVGSWSAKAKLWMDPSQPPTESEGTMKVSPALGGRFFISEHSASLMGQPFSGFGFDGYDNLKKKHVGTWADTWGTMLMTFEGDCSQSGKVTTTVSNFLDPMTKAPTSMKAVTTVVDDRTMRFEAFTKGPDGKEFKTMEINYSRQ